MSIAAMGTGLKTRLETITNLTVYGPTELPDTINVLPCALIIWDATNYLLTLGDDIGVTFDLIILVGHKANRETLNLIPQYAEVSGGYSVSAAIYGDSDLAGGTDFSIVKSSHGGVTDWGEDYNSIQFKIECQDS